MRLSLELNKIWFAFALVKVAYMFLALFVFSKFTQLGDTFRYLSGVTFGSDQWYKNSTHMMDNLAHSASILLGPVLANLPFALLSMFGIYYAVQRLCLNNNELIVLLVLLSFPSFGVWTSIASKEAMGVFYLGVILGFIIDVIKRNPKKNYLLVAFSFYLCVLFKPQYIIGILALLTFVFLSRKFSLKGTGKLILIGVFFAASFFVLYLFRHQINQLGFNMPVHFSLDAGSTRENTLWLNDFDVFWSAPYGMFIGFVGPTISEALSKPTHLIALLESSLILGVFLYAVLKLLLISLYTGKINVFFLGVFITPTLWILFVHYPFGALNPGSAIRYRGNFYAFLVILFYFGYIEVQRNHQSFKLYKQRQLSRSPSEMNT